jgi:hypothetical protein
MVDAPVLMRGSDPFAVDDNVDVVVELYSSREHDWQ